MTEPRDMTNVEIAQKLDGLYVEFRDSQPFVDEAARRLKLTDEDAGEECRRLRWWLEFIGAQNRTDYGVKSALSGEPIPTALEPKDLPCDHKHYAFDKHGRRCTCGELMMDWGD